MYKVQAASSLVRTPSLVRVLSIEMVFDFAMTPCGNPVQQAEIFWARGAPLYVTSTAEKCHLRKHNIAVYRVRAHDIAPKAFFVLVCGDKTLEGPR